MFDLVASYTKNDLATQFRRLSQAFHYGAYDLIIDYQMQRREQFGMTVKLEPASVPA